MQIQLLAFGQITDIIGDTDTVYNARNTAELIAQLHQQYPTLQQITYAIAVNKKIVQTNTELKTGDSVALLPPFSGG